MEARAAGAPLRAGAVVVVTGCSGRIGLAATAELARRGFSVVGIDAVERPAFAGARFVKCDIADRGAVAAAVAGADAVVHLAAVPDDAPFAEHLVPANVLGVASVLDAVRAAPSVRRLVVASSGKIFSGYNGPTPVDVDTPPQPTCMYSATKLFAEAAALALANSCPHNNSGGGGSSSGGGAAEGEGAASLHVIVPRFGWLPRTKDDVDAMSRITASGADGVNAYLSPGDAGRFVAACVTVPLDPSRRFALVYAQSRPQPGADARFSVRAAKEVLAGWAPLDTFPEGVGDVLGDVDYKSNPGLFPRELSPQQAEAAAATAAAVTASDVADRSAAGGGGPQER